MVVMELEVKVLGTILMARAMAMARVLAKSMEHGLDQRVPKVTSAMTISGCLLLTECRQSRFRTGRHCRYLVVS